MIMGEARSRACDIRQHDHDQIPKSVTVDMEQDIVLSVLKSRVIIGVY